MLAGFRSEAFEGTSHFREDVFVFFIEGLGSDSQLMREPAALKGMNEELTASLKTALLH